MQGLLFTTDFLREGIRDTPGWLSAEAEFIAFRQSVERTFRRSMDRNALNEAQTEDEFIIPVLEALGWERNFLRQQTANQSGRADVPDFLLFPDSAAKESAMAIAARSADRRYRHGVAILEAKRWGKPLDRSDSADVLDPGTPSSQMLRYLSRVEVASDRAIKWGVLSNGQHWRLYWQDARSRAEEFLEFDLLALSGVAPVNADLFASANTPENLHLLRAFFLLFRRQAFLPQAGDGRSFHALALDEGRLWESKVSQDLGKRVFEDIFPELTTALARHDQHAMRPCSREYLEQVHRAALILLYRLLFVLYAEDRNLLPVHDPRYDDYSLRWLRSDIARRIDAGDTFSATATRVWQHLRSLFRAIDRGDDSLGLPPYNGGLFHEESGSLLSILELPDADLAPILDGLSRRPDLSGRAFINFRDLAVQHLGSIYERLLEQKLVEADDGALVVKPSPFARKNSGSYYTHDDLVKLILREALAPLASERIAAFDAAITQAARGNRYLSEQQINIITACDPAEALLKLKVCDPAMGSGHFLVSLVDDLADRILEQLADAPIKAMEAGIAHYQSPIARDIVLLRERILAQATQGNWAINPALLDDRHLVRRMILKRVVHGADKNPMAVELAKLALWLHTFTVGAPLSFLDHHLRCGDSLYGERLGTVRRDLARLGSLFNDAQVSGLLLAAQTLGEINAISDIDLREVERSRSLMEQAYDALDGLKRVFDVWQALRWIAPLDAPRRLRGEKHRAAVELLSGRYRLTLMEMLSGAGRVQSDDEAVDAQVNELLDECRALARSEGFLHWELAFPGVWPNPGSTAPGGFDAVIGNPPWDRMKLQEVEWFADRKPEIALQTRAADRKRMIDDLKRNGDPLAEDYALASHRAEDGARVARDCGEFPMLSGGDINLYSLFVERSAMLVAPGGTVGLLTPSGIAGDKGAADFFRSLSTTGRLAALFDFENRRVFFPDVHASFKFCALIFGGGQRQFTETRCAFYLHEVASLNRDEFLIELGASDFSAVNPNTGTAPIFRSRRDAELTTRIYREHPVLVRHTWQEERNARTGEVALVRGDDQRAYPVRYSTMFHMTNDSSLFRSESWLNESGGYKIASNRWRCEGVDYVPLYEGKMVQAYDHRAASVVVNPENLHRPAQPLASSEEQHADPAWLPNSQFWVPLPEVSNRYSGEWVLGFKEISAPTNMRTMIAVVMPLAGFGNKVPLLLPGGDAVDYASCAATLLANLNAQAFDFVCRQKLQGQTLNLYIVEQLPVIDQSRFAEAMGGGTVADLIHREVLHLSYTAHDLAPFARDLGYDGSPFIWNAEDRRHRLARLDALFFRLYGLSREEAEYVLDTFPIVREADEAAFGRYRTKDLVLGYMNALAAGDVDSILAV